LELVLTIRKNMLIDKKYYKAKQDPEDFRDFVYQTSNNTLKDHVDLRKYCSPVENQRHLGSCTGQAVAGAYELLLNKEVPNKFTDLSRLFIYYNARLIENMQDSDVGAYMRDAIKAVEQHGICSESIWPYNIRNFAVKPNELSYEDAKQRNIKNYYRILNVQDTLDALNNGLPVSFSFRVYPGFDDLDNSSNYILPLPKKGEEPIGGHAMVFVGYDIPKQLFIVRNSFGRFWCDNGYCYMPFQYVTDEVMDSWVFDIDLK